MLGVLFAERAVFGHLHSVVVVPLVFVTVVVAMLALGTFESDFGSHV